MMRNAGQKLDMHVRHSQKGWLPNSCAHAWLPCWIGVHEHKLGSRESVEICLLSVLMNPQNRLSVIGPHSITRQSGIVVESFPAGIDYYVVLAKFLWAIWQWSASRSMQIQHETTVSLKLDYLTHSLNTNAFAGAQVSVTKNIRTCF